ncbi:MAG: hypothetical protein WAU68_14590 [Vitreimonas sp.]
MPANRKEIVELAVFLASDRVASLEGGAFTIDGGAAPDCIGRKARPRHGAFFTAMCSTRDDGLNAISSPHQIAKPIQAPWVDRVACTQAEEPMYSSRTISVTINKPAADVYAFAHAPENFVKWASGLAISITKEGRDWIAETRQGKVRVRFTPFNPYGVLDHWVSMPDGAEIYVPLRVIANGEAADVTFTLFRLDGDELAFERDARLVANDLRVLKTLLEADA